MPADDITVSVCIPTRNRPEMLSHCVQSVLDQTMPPREIVIGDDSDDARTEALIGRLRAATPPALIYMRNKPPLGQSRNVDRMFASAAGKWLLLIHDDDWLLPNAIESLLAPVHKQHDIDVVYGKQLVASNDGVIDYKESEALNRDFHRDRHQTGLQPSSLRSAILQQFPNDGYLLGSRLARHVGYHRAGVKDGCDFVFGVNLALAHAKFYCIDAHTAVYRLSNTSVSRSAGRGTMSLDIAATTRKCLHLLDRDDVEVRAKVREELYRAVVWCGLHRTRRVEALRWAISPRWGLRWWRREGVLAASAIIAPDFRQRVRAWLRPTNGGTSSAEVGARD
jgi:glycosyltransferase involved in cell wall biosynthesis